MTAASAPHDAEREALGTTTEAAEKLGVDMVDLFEMVAAGQLVLTRDDQTRPWQVLR